MSEVMLKFNDLTEKQKEKAREKYMDRYPPDYEWWDGVYEDAIEMMKILGIEVDTDYHAPKKEGQKGYTTPRLFFSGFSSQGDGACFAGSYTYKPDAVEKIGQATNNEELMRIAVELALLQLPRRLQGQSYYSAQITTSGSYSHSHTMSIMLDPEEADEEDIDEDAEAEMLQLMRDVADWIYRMLEQENDWLYSDERVDERLVEEEFDEYGDMI